MPAFIKTKADEERWQRAKEQAEKAGHKDDWPYVTGIYKSMSGGHVASTDGVTWAANSFDWRDAEGGRAWLRWLWEDNRKSNFRVFSLYTGRDQYEFVAVSDPAGRIPSLLAALPGVFEVTNYEDGMPEPRVARVARRYAAEVITDSACIYAISPEGMAHLFESSEWQKIVAEGKVGLGDCDMLVRKYGGAVFHTGADGAWNVTIPTQPGGMTIVDEWSRIQPIPKTACFVNAPEAAPPRGAVVTGLVPFPMGGLGIVFDTGHQITVHLDCPDEPKTGGRVAGWWGICPGKTTDGRLTPECKDSGMTIGDGPADILDTALDKVVKQYQDSMGRLPYVEEVWAAFRFSGNPRALQDVYGLHYFSEGPAMTNKQDLRPPTPSSAQGCGCKASAKRVAARHLKAMQVVPPDAEPLRAMQALLAALRHLYWVHWTAHWVSSGENSNSDHELFGRLYGALPGEIDATAEKMVAMFGPSAVPVSAGAVDLARENAAWDDHADPMHLKCLWAEEAFQKGLKRVRDALDAQGALSLGLDNFLQGLADAHETHVYLLRRRAAPTTPVT